MNKETVWDKIARISKEVHILNHEQETGEINPEEEKELRAMGFTDEYFRQRKAGILEVKEMRKHPLTPEEKLDQMIRHNANR